MNFQQPLRIPRLSPDYEKLVTMQRMADSQEQYAKEVAALRQELEHLRNDNAQYRADRAAEREHDRKENAKAHKQISRRSWAQIIIPLILSPLITLFIEHFDQVCAFFARLFA